MGERRDEREVLGARLPEAVWAAFPPAVEAPAHLARVRRWWRAEVLPTLAGGAGAEGDAEGRSEAGPGAGTDGLGTGLEPPLGGLTGTELWALVGGLAAGLVLEVRARRAAEDATGGLGEAARAGLEAAWETLRTRLPLGAGNPLAVWGSGFEARWAASEFLIDLEGVAASARAPTRSYLAGRRDEPVPTRPGAVLEDFPADLGDGRYLTRLLAWWRADATCGAALPAARTSDEALAGLMWTVAASLTAVAHDRADGPGAEVSPGVEAAWAALREVLLPLAGLASEAGEGLELDAWPASFAAALAGDLDALRTRLGEVSRASCGRWLAPAVGRAGTGEPVGLSAETALYRAALGRLGREVFGDHAPEGLCPLGEAEGDEDGEEPHEEDCECPVEGLRTWAAGLLVAGEKLRESGADGRPRWVPPAEIAAERARGWTGFHPETYCHRCGRRNVPSWAVESRLWNVAGVEAETPSGIVCPPCFVELFEAAGGGSVTWRLVPDPDTCGGLRADLRGGTGAADAGTMPGAAESTTAAEFREPYRAVGRLSPAELLAARLDAWPWSARVRQAVTFLGLTTVGDLLALPGGARALREVRGVGDGAVQEVRQALLGRGLTLADGLSLAELAVGGAVVVGVGAGVTAGLGLYLTCAADGGDLDLADAVAAVPGKGARRAWRAEKRARGQLQQVWGRDAAERRPPPSLRYRLAPWPAAPATGQRGGAARVWGVPLVPVGTPGETGESVEVVRPVPSGLRGRRLVAAARGRLCLERADAEWDGLALVGVVGPTPAWLVPGAEVEVRDGRLWRVEADGGTAAEPVAVVGFSTRVVNALEREGIATVGELAQRTEQELRRLPGVGAGSVAEIRQALAKRHLRLAQEGAP